MKKRLRIEYFLLRQSCFYYLSEVLRRPIFSFKRNGCSARNLFKKKNTLLTDQLPLPFSKRATDKPTTTPCHPCVR